MHQTDFSDRLFLVGLLLMIAGIVIAGIGPQLLFPMKKTDNLAEYDTKQGKRLSIDRQDKALGRLKKSILLWLGVGLMVVSILLSYW